MPHVDWPGPLPRAVFTAGMPVPIDSDNNTPDLEHEAGASADVVAAPVRSGFGRATTVRPPPREAKKRIIKDRFILEEQIGVGGMGSVYKARDLRKVEARDRNPWVAIKLLNQSVNQHPEAFIALQREARKSQTLAHPNIVPVYDFDRAGDTFFMTMELQTGASLDQVIRRHPRGLPYEDACRIIRDAGTALQYAHEHNIVHADFKPGNIFLTDTGKTKVFDFGIARVVSTITAGTEDEKTLFNPAEVGGLTPAYASLEMLRGQEPAAGDDVFALACIAYELFSGRHPYRRIPVTKAWKKLVWPRRIWSLRRRQWRVLRKALSRYRQDRYASVEAFLNDFFAVGQPEPGLLRYDFALALTLAGLGLGLVVNASHKQQQAEQLLAAATLRDAIHARRTHRQEAIELLQQQARTHFSDFADSEEWHRQMLALLASIDRQLVDGSWLELYRDAAAKDALNLPLERQHFQRAQHRLRQWLLLFEAGVEARFMVLSRRYLQQGDLVAAARAMAFALDYGSDAATVAQRVAEIRAAMAQPDYASAPAPLEELQTLLDDIAGRLAGASPEEETSDPCAQASALQSGCADRFLDGSDRTGPPLVALPADEAGPVYWAIGRYEVSVDEFVEYCRDTGHCDDTATGRHPVSDIAVDQVQGYLEWLSAHTGFEYRLPTLLQWRAAAPGAVPSQDANCSTNLPWIASRDGLWPVDSGSGNALGLRHVVGNVRELVLIGDELWVAGGSRRGGLAGCSVTSLAPAPEAGDPVTGFRVARKLSAANPSVVGMQGFVELHR